MIGNSPNPKADVQFTMAIADLIYGCRLLFSLTSDPNFRSVVSLARTVTSNYPIPIRNQVAGGLLDVNYQHYTKIQWKSC